MSLKKKIRKLRRTLKKSNKKIDTFFNINKETSKMVKKNSKINQLMKPFKEFKIQGISYLQGLSENTICDFVKNADIYYYKHNISLLSDDQYDVLKQFALQKYPGNEILENGHMNIVINKDKVNLPYYMGSQEKIKPNTNSLKNWLKDYHGPYVLSSKLDGISALYYVENGKRCLYTRGNGYKGQDISHLIPYINGCGLVDGGFTIRGELLIRKDVFQDKFSDTYKNVRNLIGGVMTTKKVEIDKWKSIDFVAYEVIKPSLNSSAQMKWIQSNGFNVVNHRFVETIDNQSLSNLLLELRKTDYYNIDGVIVSNDSIYERTDRKNPKHSFAFKMVLSDQIMESQVVDVIWTPSKDGYIIPRIQIVPVEIGGATITFASAHNAAFIYKNNIGIGSVVQMVRSGDVIPKILKVVKPSDKPKMPVVSYVWNSSGVNILLEEIDSNHFVQMKNILYFMKMTDVPYFGEGNVRKIFKEGYNTIHKILNMKLVDFLKIPGFKEKMALKMIQALEEKIKTCSLSELMVGSNIFGRGLGIKKAKLILKYYPTVLVSNASCDEKIERILSIGGFALKTAQMFVPHITTFIQFLKENNLTYKLVDFIDSNTSNTSNNNVLNNKKIVMTGFRNKDLEKLIVDSGGDVVNTVSKNTFILLVDSLNSTSSKVIKAKKLGISIMTPFAFANKYFD